MKQYLKMSNKFCIIIIAMAFLLGISVCDDYGINLDQHTEEFIMMSNIEEYFNKIGIKEIHHWGEISDSIEKDHGEAPYYPLGFYWMIKKMDSDNMESFPMGTAHVWYVYTFVIFFIGCLALYGIVYELFHDHKISLVTFLLYYMTPRFFAEGHYNNKDIVFLSFGIMVLYFGIRYLYSRKFIWGFFFAIVAAFMTNIKILGAWFFAIPGIIYIITGIKNKELDWRKVKDGFGTIIVYLITYIIITPAFWSGRLEYIQYCLNNASSFSRWTGNVVYAGKEFIITENGGSAPAEYLPINILYTTPLILLVLCLIGNIRAFIAIVKKEKNAVVYIMILIAYVVPFVYALLNRNLVVYNGWRHFYFVYGGMVTFMGVGLREILIFLKTKWKKVVLCGSILIYLLSLLIAGHPYQYSYINFLAKRPAEKMWQLDYWCMGGISALEKLCESEQRNQELELIISSKRMEMLILPCMFYEKWANTIHYVALEEQPNYIICTTTYYEPPQEGYHLLFTIEAYGNCLYEVYEIDK